MDDERNREQSERDVGQGDRDVDAELAKEIAEGKHPLGKGHTAMPDFTSGPGYTGQIPPEGADTSERDLNRGGDISE